MFSGLQVLGKSVNVPLSAEEVVKLRDRNLMLQAALRYSAAQCAITSGLAQLKATTHDFSDLRRLGRVIKKHGINRPLMAFATHAHTVVSKLPANESLDVISAGVSDPRTQGAIAGIEETLDTETDLVADWVRTGADNVDALFSSTALQIEGFGEAISHYLTVLEDRESDDGLAGSVLTAAPFEATRSCIEALLDVFPDLDAMVSDPTDRDAMDAHKAKLARIVDKIGPHTGLMLDPNNPHQLQVGVCSGPGPTTDTFSSLGYTVENLLELLRKADNLVDEVNGLLERKEAIVGQSTTLSMMMKGMNPSASTAI